ncbi:hypothetical protein H4Q26_001424 [Puccinia striiformis f. sp. tritici PST-130]|nr:hypothetical protein H4Q26_001424 [Puccinia striiformis f. sp. tritici PST-130]
MAGLTKIVFVGNLPYSHSDENNLNRFLQQSDPSATFELRLKRKLANRADLDSANTFDTQTADSAIRNLQGIEIGGRALRLDFADVGNHDTRDAGDDHLRNSGPITTGLPPDLPRAEITGQMKQLVASAPDQARQLLNANPQLTYALFQAMLMMGVVDASILTRMLAPAAMQKQQQQQQPIPQAAMPSHQMPVGFGANAYAQQPMRPGGMTQQPSYSTPLAPLPNYGITPQQAAPQPVQPAPVIPQQQQQQQPQVVQQPQQNATTAAAQQQAQLIQQVLSLTPNKLMHLHQNIEQLFYKLVEDDWMGRGKWGECRPDHLEWLGVNKKHKDLMLSLRTEQ